MINRVVLVGRLTRDPELRYTPSAVAVTTFTLAVETGYGEKKQTSFIPVVVWRQLAELSANYLKKGSQCGVDGRLTTRSYDNKEGKKVFVTEVVAENVQFLTSSNSENRQSIQSNDPFANDSRTINISDDDLPF